MKLKPEYEKISIVKLTLGAIFTIFLYWAVCLSLFFPIAFACELAAAVVEAML